MEVDRSAALSLSLFGDVDVDSPTPTKEYAGDADEIIDSYVAAWVSVAETIAKSLEASASVWKKVVSSENEIAFLKKNPSTQWLAALTRISFVAHCLLASLKSHGKLAGGEAASEGVRILEKAIAATDTTEGSAGSVMDASHAAAASIALPGGLDPWSDSRAIVKRANDAGEALGGDIGRLPHVPHCNLTLLPLSSLHGVSVVAWEGRSCLAPVANWWANQAPHVDLP